MQPRPPEPDGRGRGRGPRRPRLHPAGSRLPRPRAAPVRLRGRERASVLAPRERLTWQSPPARDSARAVGRGSIGASGGPAASQPGGARGEQVARGRWSGARLGLGLGLGWDSSLPAQAGREWGAAAGRAGEPGWARAGAGRRTAASSVPSEPGVPGGRGHFHPPPLRAWGLDVASSCRLRVLGETPGFPGHGPWSTACFPTPGG